jgi:uncharacterized protein (UPF0548 family)
MLSLQQPSAKQLQAFLTTQAKLDFTCSTVGATSTQPPPGYVVDRTRVQLGAGAKVFAAARTALARWDHFRLGWVESWPANAAIEKGQVVAVLARILGLWWVNACRIVYLVDEKAPVSRFGFAYGTLPQHAESGEERFTIEWHKEDDGVWYDILAFSRPHQLLARLGYPYVRRLQKRFAKDSAAAMERLVKVCSG